MFYPSLALARYLVFLNHWFLRSSCEYTPQLDTLSLAHCAVSKLKPNLFALVTLNIDSARIFAQPFTLDSFKKNGTLFVCVKVLVTEVKALDFTLYHLFLVLLFSVTAKSLF